MFNFKIPVSVKVASRATINKNFTFWIYSSILVAMVSIFDGSGKEGDLITYKDLVIRFCAPLLFVLLIVGSSRWCCAKKVGYFLFFVTPVLTLFGCINTLTGFASNESLLIANGVPFYTVSLAAFYINERGSTPNIWMFSNPLFLITGPIFGLIKKYQRVRFSRRFVVYFPYFLIGIFSLRL